MTAEQSWAALTAALNAPDPDPAQIDPPYLDLAADFLLMTGQAGDIVNHARGFVLVDLVPAPPDVRWEPAHLVFTALGYPDDRVEAWITSYTLGQEQVVVIRRPAPIGARAYLLSKTPKPENAP